MKYNEIKYNRLFIRNNISENTEENIKNIPRLPVSIKHNKIRKGRIFGFSTRETKHATTCAHC